MKRLFFLFLAAIMMLCANAQPKKANLSTGYPITPVPFTKVKVTDKAFWGQRLEASRNVTIPLAFSKCEETGRYKNFEDAAKHLKDSSVEYPDKSWTYSFDDTDPYKTIEGASYLLQTYPNALYNGRRMDKYIDSVVAIIGSAQEPDGYLYTPRTKAPSKPHSWAGMKRWELVEELSHEFYNLGHMVEGAVAHYQATGKTNFLDIAKRYADCVIKEVGYGEGQDVKVPGHQIAEMALCRLYLATGEKKYLDQAKFFLDARGKTSHRNAYNQTHIPVTEQKEAVGHAVRATYMYAGMADVAALTGDKAYINAIDSIWENIVTKKYYITGGIGARHSGEAFGNNYELPNATAYCETCAAIGNVYVNHRLFLLHGESKYYDVVERTLYNALIDGVSLDGGTFFYPNPLATASDSKYKREPWFGCACCPSNISRFIPSLPGYIYATKDIQGEASRLYVNLFMSNKGDMVVGRKKISIEQQTGYPYNDKVNIRIANGKQKFAMYVRIPGWAKNEPVPGDLYRYVDGKKGGYSIMVNGKEVENVEIRDGYAVIERQWKKGDLVELSLNLEPRMVAAHRRIVDDRGRIAVERGPIVYCAEWPDNQYDINTYLLNRRPEFTVTENESLKVNDNLSHAYTTITTNAQVLSYGEDGKLKVKDAPLKLIPYYAWDHRGQKGGMQVWLPIEVGAASASKSAKVTTEDNGFFNH